MASASALEPWAWLRPQTLVLIKSCVGRRVGVTDGIQTENQKGRWRGLPEVKCNRKWEGEGSDRRSAAIEAAALASNALCSKMDCFPSQFQAREFPQNGLSMPDKCHIETEGSAWGWQCWTIGGWWCSVWTTGLSGTKMREVSSLKGNQRVTVDRTKLRRGNWIAIYCEGDQSKMESWKCSHCAVNVTIVMKRIETISDEKQCLIPWRESEPSKTFIHFLRLHRTRNKYCKRK